MLSKLAFRNMKRSARDYLVYILTMTVVTALMYSFNSLFFQNDLAVYFSTDGTDFMAVMVGLSTVFIVLIVSWLIKYMVRFMLEKRSMEFGIYLLLGMKKKTVSTLYVRENLLLGGGSFLLGCVLGVLMQQLLLSIMFAMVRMEFHLHISISRGTILMTLLCYAGCYLLALSRCRRKIRKMNIRSLMNARRQNEEIREKHEELKQILLPLAILFILLFWALWGRITSGGEILLFLIGLVLTIYLFYTGLSAWIICYVRRRGNGVYRSQNLFLLRQFASKVRTMQFTMGTLTALFTLALLGASCALMLNDFENAMLDGKFPFDIQIFSADVEDDFADEKAIIDECTTPSSYYAYHVYTDHDIRVNTWIMTHLKTWGTIYHDPDGSPNMPKIQQDLEERRCYYRYDTYMGLSDYNHLRGMLGYEQIPLTPEEYLVQTKPRLYEDVQGIGAGLQIMDASGQTALRCAYIVDDAFCQNGHNGADYIIVVPDAVLERMQPYYSELVADIDGPIPPDLQNRLEALLPEDDFGRDMANDLSPGSDSIVVYAAVHLVRENVIPEIKYVLGSIIIPLFYIGLVFVCVAVTVLSVQQLSDSAKYKFRYDVLAKLGLDRRQIRQLIMKQLAAYYLCPAILAAIISGKLILFVSRQFLLATGLRAMVGRFFLKSIALFGGIYLVYFIVTYVGFRRNVEEKSR